MAEGVDGQHELAREAEAAKIGRRSADNRRAVGALSRPDMGIDHGREALVPGGCVFADDDGGVRAHGQQRRGAAADAQCGSSQQLELGGIDLERQSTFQTEDFRAVDTEGRHAVDHEGEGFALGGDVQVEIALALIFDGVGMIADDLVLQQHRGVVIIPDIIHVAREHGAVVLHHDAGVRLVRVAHVEEAVIAGFQLEGVGGVVLFRRRQFQIQHVAD